MARYKFYIVLYCAVWYHADMRFVDTHEDCAECKTPHTPVGTKVCSYLHYSRHVRFLQIAETYSAVGSVNMTILITC